MSALDGIDGAIEESMKELRKEAKSSLDWLLCGFESPDNSKLVLLGSGSGGITELAGKVPDADMAYGVVRKEFAYDEGGGGMGATTVTKFIRVSFRPESKLPIKRKMKMGTLDGAIKKVLGSTHADLEAETPDELTEQALMELIERITQKKDNTAAADGKQASTFLIGGVASNSRTAAGDSAAAQKRHDAYFDNSNLTGAAKGAEVAFEDPEAVQEAIRKVRDDKDSTTWCLTGYKDKKTVELIGSGEGDVTAILDACKDATVCYGIFRVTEQIDKTTAVKFCFLVWQPEDVPVMMRAAISTHKGVITPMFRPFHVDFAVSKREELSPEAVMDHIMGLSGTKSHVTDKAPEHKQEVYERKFLGGVKAEEVQLEFVDRDALAQAVQAVRSDKDDTNWVAASYQIEGKNVKLGLKGQGSGGLEELSSCLFEDKGNMTYGFYRTTQVVDMSTTVKFVFVTYQGPDIPNMIKAKVTTLRGGVVPVFHPYHGEFFVDGPDELTEETVQKRLT